MLAIDTNILVRFITDDDAAQAARARAVIDTEQVWVATTVLLETEWVLRSAYGYPAVAVAGALRSFAGLPMVTLENPRLSAAALYLSSIGVDFADALHVSAADACDGFVTFDRELISAAKTNSIGIEVREP